MGHYSVSDLESILEENGEVMVVLDSDREYELHPKDTTFHEGDGEVEVEGFDSEEHEWKAVHFPADAVEHWYRHAALR